MIDIGDGPAPLLSEHWLDQPVAQIARGAPVEEIHWPLAGANDIAVAIKREELLHPALGGNKFYKLHGHLQAFARSGHTQLLSFGGPWSNHIYALAAASAALDIPVTGVIRGERPANPSPTLQFAERCGMALRFISRSQYRRKDSPPFLEDLAHELGPFYCIPEGGGDLTGAQGCALWAAEAVAMAPWQPTHVALACGTGGTAAGVLAGARVPVVQGFLALKGSENEYFAFEQDVVLKAQALTKNLPGVLPAFRLETGYSCGGYAKYPAELADFSQSFTRQTGVVLDRVYTAKLFWGIASLIKQGAYSPGSRILVLHTGGLQGNAMQA